MPSIITYNEYLQYVTMYTIIIKNAIMQQYTSKKKQTNKAKKEVVKFS